jgi:hypothetical protein
VRSHRQPPADVQPRKRCPHRFIDGGATWRVIGSRCGPRRAGYGTAPDSRPARDLRVGRVRSRNPVRVVSDP